MSPTGGALALLVALLPATSLAEGDARDAEIFGAAEAAPAPAATPDAPAATASAPAAPAPPAAPGTDAAREAELFGASADALSKEAAPPLPAPTAGDDAAAREASLFGGDDTGPATDPSSTSPIAAPEATPGPRARDTEAAAAARLAEAYDTLSVGGLLYLRGQYNALESGAPGAFDLSTPNFVDVYLDARPADRVRGYLRTRVYHDPTVTDGETDAFGNVREQTRLLIDQLWVKTDVDRTLFLTVGRQRIKWGASRFWNPTDFVNQSRLDPLAVLDERTGVSLLKLHLPIERWGWNFYALANLEGASRPDEVGGALRAEIVVLDAELSLSAAARRNNPLRLGADVSFALWNFDVRGELAVSHGVTTSFYEGELDLSAGKLPTAYSREDDFIPQAVVGAELPIRYSDEDSLTLGAEYFWNDAGYDDASIYPYLLFQGRYEPLYVGRHYAGAYAALIGPGNWDFTSFILSTLGNLSDRSFLSRFDYRVLLLSYLRLDAHVAVHYGRSGELHLGLDVPPVPGVPGLEDGLSRAPPLLDVGVGLAVDL